MKNKSLTEVLIIIVLVIMSVIIVIASLKIAVLEGRIEQQQEMINELWHLVNSYIVG